MVQVLGNLENQMAREIGKLNCFPCKFSTMIFLLHGKQSNVWGHFPSYTIHFHGVYFLKKGRVGELLSETEKPQCLTEPRGSISSRRPFLSLPRPSPFSLHCFPSPAGISRFSPMTDNPHLSSFFLQDRGANIYQVYCKARNPTQTTVLRNHWYFDDMTSEG